LLEDDGFEELEPHPATSATTPAMSTERLGNLPAVSVTDGLSLG
jgi:hypothetical protein